MPSAASWIAAAERVAIALGDNRKDRAVCGLPLAVAAARAMEQFCEQRIGAHHAAVLVHRRDRHRGVVEEPHEADFGGALRIGAIVTGAIEHQRARRTRHAVGAESKLVEHPDRQRATVAHAQIEIEHFGFDLARRAVQRGEQRRAFAGDKVGKLESAGADLRQILVEPIGERGVEIDNVAFLIDREESRRRMIEIIDRVLQHLEHVLLPVALGGDVGKRPDRELQIATAGPERADLEPQPARRPALHAGDTHFFFEALAFARGLKQPVDRLRRVGIADECALDRAHVVSAGGVGEIEIGGIGIDDAAVAVSDDDGGGGAVDQRLDQRIAAVRSGHAQKAAGEGEQREHPDGGEHREEGEDIRFGIAGAAEHNRGRGGNKKRRDQKDEADAAAAADASAAIDRGTNSGPPGFAAGVAIGAGFGAVTGCSVTARSILACCVMPRFQCLAPLNRARVLTGFWWVLAKNPHNLRPVAKPSAVSSDATPAAAARAAAASRSR